ncbi:MAG: hypothetical protein ACRDKT_11915 [Actinomycetota bacterium]
MGGLMVVVVFMAGDAEKRKQLAINIALTVAVLVLLALVMGAVTKGFFE